MFKKASRLITLIMIAALALSVFCGAFAAESDASFTIRTIDGYSSPIGGARFGLFGPDGSMVSSATTGADGSAVMVIPADSIGDEGETGFTLVQTAAPSGYEATDNNWAVTVNVTGGNTTVSVDAMGLWDTMFDWIDGTVLTGAEYENGTLTVANTAAYYDIPACYKTVSGLNADQIKTCTSSFELTNEAGTTVATGHAIGFSEQPDGSYTAQIAFDIDKLAAGTYTLSEKDISSVSGMDLKSTATVNGSRVVVGSNCVGETVIVTYAEHYIAPVTSPVADETDVAENDTDDDSSTDIGDEAVPDSSSTPDTTIDDDAVPTSDAPEQSNSTVWIIVVAACVILAATIFFITGKKNSNVKK